MNQAPAQDLATRYPSASPSRLQSLTLAQADTERITRPVEKGQP